MLLFIFHISSSALSGSIKDATNEKKLVNNILSSYCSFHVVCAIHHTTNHIDQSEKDTVIEHTVQIFKLVLDLKYMGSKMTFKY